MRVSVLFTLFVAGILNGCKPATAPPRPDLLAANIDSSVSPAENFFMYANGGWIKRTAIPASESEWGIFNMVDSVIYDRLKKVNLDAADTPSRNGSVTQKIGDFWFSAMDTLAIEKAKLSPLRPELDRIAAMGNSKDMVDMLAFFHNLNIDVAFADKVGQDDKRADLMAYFLEQDGLGMRNRDYYFNTDSATVLVRAAYREFIYRSFLSVNPDTTRARGAAAKVFALESRLARISRSRVALRDPYKNYNKMSMAGLQTLCRAIDWTSYFHQIGIGHPDSVIVGQPEFFSNLDKEWRVTPMEDWKVYFTFHLLESSAGALDSVSRNNLFAYQRTMSGATAQRPRWKQVLDAEEGVMGEALGQLFVKEYFSPQDKDRYRNLVENMRKAYAERIKKLSWMSDSTKTRAFEKLGKINVKVGYPDKWKDISTLSIDRGPWVLNLQHSNAWWRAREIKKLGKPVDKTEWGMSPQTYNAYYDGVNNEVLFPAAIFMVPGYRNDELDDAFVYGYTAASTIGHEITHGFDDQGRLYDASGNLKGWWQAADSVAFTAKAAQIVKQFNGFNPVDTLHVNGAATEGENIADLGGLVIGLDAFKKTAAYQRNEKIGGFTPLQRYFLAYAYSWLLAEKPARLASQVMADEHAPAQERVNGPLANIPEFYQAFGIKAGSPMYQPDSLRVSIW